MNKNFWRLFLLALPATLFAGTVSLSDGTDIVFINGAQINIGSGNTISGTANASGLLIAWSFSTAINITASGVAPNYTLSGGTGTFAINDTPSGGGDSVGGSVSLLTATESGGSNENMALGGTVTANSLVTGGNAGTTTAFLALLSQIGITPPVPPNKTETLVINVTGCNIGGISVSTTVSCLPSNTSLASIQAVGETGTVTSVGITGAVPEPATMLLMGTALIGLFVSRRLYRKA